MPSPLKIAAIVVTRNRLDLLKKCIAAIRAQTRPADAILVVDNASDDGTGEWLKEQTGLMVFEQENLGAAGGFCRGIKEACQQGYDAFWLMDDDTIPQPEALDHLARAVAGKPYGFACSLALWRDDTPHMMNNPQIANGIEWYHTVLGTRVIPSKSASYVSLLVSREAITQCGLPAANMYLWYDDAEFTTRIARHFPSYFVLDSLVVHETAENTYVDLASLNGKNWEKFRWGIRNMVAYNRMYRRSTAHYCFFLWKVFTALVSRSRAVPPQARLELFRAFFQGLSFQPKIEFL